MHSERGFPQPVAHLPNFMDRVDNGWQNPAPHPQEAPYFLFLGRLELIKGLKSRIARSPRVRAELIRKVMTVSVSSGAAKPISRCTSIT